jgi:murein DD-endopeptidase MepM/ murein hydrolase activator NlpD
VVPFDDDQEDDVDEPETSPADANATESADASAADAEAAPARKSREAKPARKALKVAKVAKAAKVVVAPVGTIAGPPAPGADGAAVRLDFDLTKLSASPVPGVESSGFGWRDDPINNRRKFHKGTDFRAPRGTSVYAAGGGVVTFAGRMGGYGNVVFIDHGNGVITRYGHLRRIGTQREAQVVAGAQIGEVGATGRATGPHLHFEVRLDGRAVNPAVAMSLAALQRTDPNAARAASIALAHQVQAVSSDPHSGNGKRPDRRGRAKRTKALW